MTSKAQMNSIIMQMQENLGAWRCELVRVGSPRLPAPARPPHQLRDRRCYLFVQACFG